MKFRYIAINQENKRLSGIISAKDEKAAREELNRLAFSIINLEKIEELPSEIKEEQRNPKYEFEAFDKYGKKIIGTIRAEHEYAAFKRLVEEYKFKVIFLCKKEASEEQKAAARENVEILKVRYDQEKEQEEKEKKMDETEQASEIEKQKLMQQVTFVLSKIREVIENFRDEIKPQEKANIKKLVNKLLRIKNSTNLEYIKKTSEELLRKVQDEEIYLHEEKMQKEKERLALETQQMILNLESIETKKNIYTSLIYSIKDWYSKFSKSAEARPKFVTKIVNSLFRSIVSTKKDPEEIAKKQQIRKTNKQIFAYVKLLFRSPKTYRQQILESIKALFQEKKKLKTEFRTIKSIRKIKEKKLKYLHKDHGILQELNSFSGWLLLFYLAYYFIANYFLTKNLDIEISWNFYFYGTTIKYFIVFVFLFHAFTSTKLVFFEKSFIANFILLPVPVILGVLVIFNL